MTETTPQDVLTITQSIINLMPVIVGGVVGIISSVAGGIVLHKVQSNDKKDQLRIEKMEKATILAYECKEWMDKYEDKNIFNGPACTTPSPLNELKALCYLYIPDAKDKLKKLDGAFCNYKVVVMDITGEKLANQGIPPANTSERIRTIYLPFKDSIDDFVSEIEKLIQP